MAKLNKTLSVALAAVVAATQSPTGFAVLKSGPAGKLAEAGYAEINTSVGANEKGEVQIRATQAGIDYNTTAATPAEAKPAPSFSLVSNVPVPAIVGRGRLSAESKYPFEQMQPGQAFFVAATEDQPKPSASLASTITSANKRYSEVIPGEFTKDRNGNDVPARKALRKFVVRAVADGAAAGFGEAYKGVSGAGVWREA
jgi:hypothetical protein